MYKRVAFDIDGTITSLFPTLWNMAKYFGKPMPELELVTDYNLSSVYGITEKDSMGFWKEMEYSICKNSQADHERLTHMFKQFLDIDSEIYIITSRSEQFREVTEEWLSRNVIPYKELIMTSGKSKVDVLRENEIDLMVDDKPSLFYEAKEAGLKTRMVCVDYPYNQSAPCDLRLSRDGMVMSHRTNTLKAKEVPQ